MSTYAAILVLCGVSCKDTDSVESGPHLMTLINLNYLLNAPPLHIVTLWVTASTYKFEGIQFSLDKGSYIQSK